MSPKFKDDTLEKLLLFLSDLCDDENCELKAKVSTINVYEVSMFYVCILKSEEKENHEEEREMKQNKLIYLFEFQS